MNNLNSHSVSTEERKLLLKILKEINNEIHD